jgi:ABC-type transport system involved in multi-copper enzyme maturation permease subunit
VMIWTIAKRELFANIITFRFLVGLILCLAMITASAFIFARDFKVRQEGYDRNVIKHTDGTKHIPIHARIEVNIDRPPAPLGFLSMGRDKELGNMVQNVSYREVPREAVGGGSNNPYMSVFSSLDVVLIIQIVLSLLTLLLAYNTISGERERGTLAMTLSNPIPRHHILLGRLLGGIISIALPLTVAMLVGLLVVLTTGSVDMDGQTWVRVGLVFLCSLLYLSAIFMLGILVSARTRKAATSLVILLFIWVVLVTLLPNLGPYVATHLQRVEDKAIVDANCGSLGGEFFYKCMDYGSKLMQEGKYPPDLWRYMEGHAHNLHHPYPAWVHYAPRENMIWFMEGLRYCLPLHLEYADRIWELYRSYEEQLHRQVALSNNISRASPAWAYYNAASILAGTDSSVYTHFMDQARRYRQELISYSRSQKGFSSMSYFTMMKMDETLTYTELAEMESTQGLEAIERHAETFGERFWTTPLQGIPVFRYQSESLSESIRRALPDLLILALLNIVLLMAAYASFMRQEVK